MNDLVIDNVTVWAGARPRPMRGWVAIKAGRFSAVGSEAEAPPGGPARLDGEGKTLLPGFVDCHTHVTAGAIASVCRSGAAFRSRDDALKAVGLAAREDASSWLIFFYVDWSSWDVPVPPTARELEEASGGRKVFMACASLHRGILSESALRDCNVHQRLGSDLVETRHGTMSGVVWEDVFSECMKRVLDEFVRSLSQGDLEEILKAEVKRHLAFGITDAHDPCVNSDMCEHMVALNAESPLRLSWSQVGVRGTLSTAGDGEALGSFGHGPSSAKVFTDGAHRCAVCVDAAQAIVMTIGAIGDAIKSRSHYPLRQMLQADVVFRGGKFHRVGALFEPEALTSKLAQLSASHERIKIHALGNHAVDMACDCVVESGITTRVCIEHATILDDNNIEKLARHGVLVSVQPGFLPHYGPQFTGMRLTGRYRGLPLRSLLDSGVDVVMSSDYPCGPLDPLHNMRCAVERKITVDQTYLEREAVAQEEAVHAYTVAGSMAINGIKKGGIAVGEAADFVILTGAPFARATVVDSTWIDGHAVYQRRGGTAA
jgi:predicted amidohydrolase YtcJ